MGDSGTIWTVGHSNHPLERLLELFGAEQIDFVVDVRSYPYSRGTVRTEDDVDLRAETPQASLSGQEIAWRSTQSVSHRRRLSASSVA